MCITESACSAPKHCKSTRLQEIHIYLEKKPGVIHPEAPFVFHGSQTGHSGEVN